MKKLIATTCVAFLACFGTANANLISNGDFETGNFSGWDRKGDVRIWNTSNLGGGLAALQGMDNYFALLGAGISEGNSTLRQDFEIVGLSQIEITFDWAFDYWDNSRTAEDTFLSFVRQDGKPALRISLLDLTTHGNGFFSPDGGFAYGTYSNTIDISSYQTDDARLVFRLQEESDANFWTGTASLAGIDNVSITASPVPEPATMLLFGTGIAGLAAIRRRKR